MASPFSNYGGFTTPAPIAIGTRATPPAANWGSTFLGDLFQRPDFKSAILEEYMYRNSFQASGVIARNTAMDGREGAVVTTMPFFQPFEAFEEEIDSNATWGASGKGYLTPQKINSAQFRVPFVHRGFAAAVDDLSQMGSGEDPMAAIRSYIAANMNKFRNDYLFALLDGMFKTGGPLAGQVLNVATATGTGSAATGAASHLNAGVVVGLQNLLGERGSDLTTIAMHSAVRNELVRMGMLTFSSPANLTATSNVQWGGGGAGVTQSAIEYFAGLRIVVDDRLDGVEGTGAASGDAKQYPVYAFGPGAVQEGIQQDFRLEADRNILSKQDVISSDWHFAMGIPGIDWKGTPAGTYPTNTEISTATNWQLKWESAQKVPIVKAIVNTPYGADKA